jgi:hypothetical protein
MSRRLLAVLGAVLILAGCGTATSPSAAPASTGPAVGRGTGPTPHGCADPGRSVTVTNTDNGGVVCLTTGGQLTLALTGGGWKQPTVDGNVLKPAGGEKFTAVSAGKATLRSSHPACPTGTVKCHALQAFQVQVVVS